MPICASSLAPVLFIFKQKQNQQQSLAENVSIFPNPADRQVTIQIGGGHLGALMLPVKPEFQTRHMR
jgi:hypothetical protein